MSSEKKCCVPGCFGSQDSHTVLHLFPNPAKDMDRFKSWLYNIGGDILAFSNDYIYKYRRVCHVHFEAKYCCRYNRISNNAVPTLHLSGPSKLSHTTTSVKKRPLTSIENIINMPSTSKDCQLLGFVQDISTPPIDMEKTKESNLLGSQICASVSKEPTFNQKKSQLLKKVTILKSKLTKTKLTLYKTLLQVKAKLANYKNMYKKKTTTLKSAKNIFTNITFLKALENMTNTGRLITLLQFRESRKKDKGRRFSEQEKLLSLAIMKQSPKAYRFLRRIFILPSPQTLGILLTNSNIGTGINKNVFAQLKARTTKMSVEERLCTLLFDEMSVKPSISYNKKKTQLQVSL